MVKRLFSLMPRAAAASKTVFRPSAFPGDGNLTELYAELLAYPNVHGCYVGAKWKRRNATGKKARAKGRSRPNAKPLAIVCCVNEKIVAHKLAKEHRVPRRIKWPRTRSKHFNLLTDVQTGEAGSLEALAPVVGPGDELQASAAANSERATIGIALKHPTLGRVVTTAGHAFIGNKTGTLLFGPTAPVVKIANLGIGTAGGTFNAIPLKASRVAEADYALLQPQGEARNLFRDLLNVSSAHVARPEDIGTPLFALRRGQSERTVLRGVAGVLTMGGLLMRGLLLTDRITQPGDSGCCLVDAGFRVWGLLVGSTVINNRLVSVFASVQELLTLEGAQLA
jgi:hypothetical protein